MGEVTKKGTDVHGERDREVLALQRNNPSAVERATPMGAYPWLRGEGRGGVMDMARGRDGDNFGGETLSHVGGGEPLHELQLERHGKEVGRPLGSEEEVGDEARG